jgi:hypothetical protein
MDNPLFLLGILIAVLFALSARKMGFYHTWTMLFNLIVAIYLAIRLGPFMNDYIPAYVSEQYSKTLSMVAIGTGAFLVLQGIAYTLLIGQFEVTFPRTVNILGTGLLGFLAGFLVWSFVLFAFYTTPLCQSQSVKELHIDMKTFEEAKTQPYLVWWCNFLDKFIASGDNPDSVTKTMKEMVTKPAKKAIADPNAKGAFMRSQIIGGKEPNIPDYPTRPAAGSTQESHTEIPP